MDKRLFYVVYVGEPILQIALDAIRLIANPREKGLAHITVRGPYSESPHFSRSVLAMEGKNVIVKGVSDFFQNGQNTVFLECHCRGLRSRWDKSDYGYQPHITLYDGPSHQFASKLRHVLGDTCMNLRFRATGMASLDSRANGHRESLRRAFSTGQLSWLLGEAITVEDVDALDDQARLTLISKLWTQHVLPQAIKRSGKAEGSQLSLFDLDKPEYLTAPVRPRDLHSIVVDAYRSANAGSSIDRVIADPDLNANFIQQCWKHGAQASQGELNRALLGARKQGKIGPLPGIRSFSVPRSQLDKYLLASEVALRLVQEEERSANERFVGLDRILCEPTLSYRFDQLARTISPGFATADYRWAALTIRKSQSRGIGLAVPSRGLRLESLGRLNQLKGSGVERQPALYRLHDGKKTMYVGQVENLSDELDRISELRFREMPILFPIKFPPTSRLRIDAAFCPDFSPSLRDSWKAKLVLRDHPFMNVLRRWSAG